MPSVSVHSLSQASQPLGSLVATHLETGLPVHCPNGLYLLQLRTLSIPEVSSSRHCCLKLPDMENTRQSILWDLGKTPASSCSSDGINTPNKACRNSDAVSVCPLTFTGKSAATFYSYELFQFPKFLHPDTAAWSCLTWRTQGNPFCEILAKHIKKTSIRVTCLTAFVFQDTGKKIHHLGHSCHVILAKLHIDPDVESLLT